MDLRSHCFSFEAEFTADLRCIPMAVRRKLDLAGLKLKLVHWTELTEAERQALLAWSDDPEAIANLHDHLVQRTAELSPGPATPLPAPLHEPWQQPEAWPDTVQRFALVKLSHPGHEHRNLPRALAEFGALAPQT